MMNFDTEHHERQAMNGLSGRHDLQSALVSAVLALAAAVERVARALEATAETPETPE
jgi:UDP-N-acetylmuramyl pentapeptide synthase